MDAYGGNPAFDQMDALFRDLVVILRNHYERCIEAGWNEEQAMRFAMSMQHTIIGSGLNREAG